MLTRCNNTGQVKSYSGTKQSDNLCRLKDQTLKVFANSCNAICGTKNNFVRWS